MSKKPYPTYEAQIYLITPPRIDDLDTFAKILHLTLAAAPVGCLQIRLKDISRQRIIEVANVLIPIARSHGTAVLINDDPSISLETGADGVHLGQSDMVGVDMGGKGRDIKSVQQMLPVGSIIGVTCHNSKDMAFRAGSDGATYVAFGSLYVSKTKPDARRADLELLTWWHETMQIPCVAIGGITVDNAQNVVAAGADFIAISSGVWDYKYGPEKAVKLLGDICAQSSRPALQ